MAQSKPAWAGDKHGFYVEVFRRRGYVQAVVYNYKGGEIQADWELPNALRNIPEACAAQAANQTLHK